jgi:hypothetical protein
MKKMIYGVKKGSNVSELVFPKKDTTGFSSLANQGIITNNISEEAVGKSFYGIRFKNGFFVFSKTHIIYDSSKRISHLSFSIILKNDEVNLDIFNEIQDLEKDYFSEKLIEQTGLQEVVKYDEVNKKSEENKKPSANIATLYNNDEELKNNFHYLDSYKNYGQIYFIKPEDKEKLRSGIKYDYFFDNINEIKKDIQLKELGRESKKLFGFGKIFRR